MLALEILFVAVGVGVPCDVEPVPRPLFAEPLAFQQSLHRRLITQPFKVGQLRRRGREAGQIEIQSATECRHWRGRRKGELAILQTSDDERIERTRHADGRDRQLHGRCECPVGFVVRPVLDPLLEGVDLPCRKGFLVTRGRHDFIGVRGCNAADEFTLLKFSWHNGGCSRFATLKCRIALIESQAAFPLLFIGSVTLGAVLGQNRLHVA